MNIMKLKIIFFILFIFVTSFLFSQDVYTFIDINSSTIEAEYLYMQDGIVRFLTLNKKIVKADFDYLSPESQKLILKLQWKEDLLSGKIKPIVYHSSPQKKKKILPEEPEENISLGTSRDFSEVKLEKQIPINLHRNINSQVKKTIYIPTHTVVTKTNRPLPELDQTKPVKVKGYYRKSKNGKNVYVRKHSRNPPGTDH